MIGQATRQSAVLQPIYWSKLETWANIASAERSKETAYYDTSGTQTYFGVSSIKFNNCIYRGNYGSGGNFVQYPTSGNAFIYPWGANNIDMTAGTLSAWVKQYTTATAGGWSPSGQAQSSLTFLSQSTTTVKVYWYDYFGAGGWVGDSSTLHLYTGGTDYSIAMSRNTVYHLGIVWNSVAPTGEKTAQVFVNGTEVLSSTDSLGDLTAENWRATLYSYCNGAGALGGGGDGTAQQFIDDLKLWDQASPQRILAEYNGSTGVEGITYL